MRLKLTVDVPPSVDETTLSYLLAAVNARQGVTIVTGRGMSIDVDLVDIERAELHTQEA